MGANARAAWWSGAPLSLPRLSRLQFRGKEANFSKRENEEGGATVVFTGKFRDGSIFEGVLRGHLGGGGWLGSACV